MKQEITENTFVNIMSEKDNWFTYSWAVMLYNYLEGFGEDLEFDAIAFRCEYSEYNIEDFIKEYCQEEFDEYYKDYTENIDDDASQTDVELEYFSDHIENTENFIWGESDCFVIINN